MKIYSLIGAVVAALAIGLTVAVAAQPDLAAHALQLPVDLHMALGLLPVAAGSHVLVDVNRVPLVAARPRGLVLAPRMDVSDANKILAELQKTFADFKTEHTAEMAALKKDVVQTEKVDRINSQIGELQTAIDGVNATIAALKVGGIGDGKETAEQREYAKAFDRFFRKGVDNGLNELAIKAAARTDSDPDGGYTVPTQMEATIDRVLSTVSGMRGIARVQSMSSDEYKKLVGQGGATSGWVGEREARTETNSPTLVELKFPAMELYANPAATQKILDDSAIDIAAWLADEVSITFAEQEGSAFISGDGVNKPRGILSYDTVADASYAWGKLGFVVSGVAAALSDSTHNGIDALLDAVYALKQGYRQNAGWLLNRKTQGATRKLKDAEGQYYWQPPVQAGQPATLVGYGVTDDDNMSDIGANAFPIAFGDFRRGYLIVDRVGMRVLRDPYTNKPYVHFYTTKRVGGGVQNFEAIKLVKIST